MILKLLQFLETTWSLGYPGFLTKFMCEIALLTATSFDGLMLWISIGKGLHGDEGLRGAKLIFILDCDKAFLLFEHVFIRHTARIFSFTPTSTLTVLKKTKKIKIK